MTFKLRCSAVFTAALSIFYSLTAIPAIAAPGDPDPSFGSGGIAMDHISGVTVYKTLIQADGKIILVGKRRIAVFFNQPERDYLFIRRYTSTGALDTSFDTNFKQGVGVDAEIAADGKLVVIGTAPNTITSPLSQATIDTTSPIVWRYNPDGRIDTSFGTSGFRYINTIATGPHSNVQVELHNGYAVIGYTSRTAFGIPSTTSHKITRLSPGGNLDYTRTLPFLVDTYSKSSSLAIDHLTGDILVAGVHSSTFNGVVRRYTIDYALVAGFGVNGEAEIPDCSSVSSYELRPQDLEVLPDGRMLLYRQFQDDGALVVARLAPSGAPDQLCLTAYLPPAQLPELYVQPDGKFFFYVGVAAGSARYFPDGTFDVLLPNFTGRANSAIQADQKIVAAFSQSGSIRIERRLLD